MKKTIVLVVLALLAVMGVAWSRYAAPAEAGPVVEVWKSPSCGCCGSWVEHMEAAGFRVRVHQTEDLMAAMGENGVPAALGSCHTARVGGYALEGHVPADLVKKLLAERPAGIRGLAVPGMVSGSPGMEGNGPAQPYQVLSFDRRGHTEVYATR